MYRTIIAITGMILLTGCSELQVIGKATLREFSAETVSVDSERYKPRPAKKRNVESQTLVAKASTTESRLEKPQQKELWRHN